MYERQMAVGSICICTRDVNKTMYETHSSHPKRYIMFDMCTTATVLDETLTTPHIYDVEHATRDVQTNK